jgi:hypothetical protein
MWKVKPIGPLKDQSGSPNACPSDGTEDDKAQSEDTPRTAPGPSQDRPHTLRRYARSDDAFPLSDRGAYAMAGARPTPSRAWRLGAPDEGRCRADPHCTIDGARRHISQHRFFHLTWEYTRSFGIEHSTDDSVHTPRKCTVQREICLTRRTCPGPHGIRAGDRHGRRSLSHQGTSCRHTTSGTSGDAGCRTGAGARERRRQRDHGRLAVHQGA